MHQHKLAVAACLLTAVAGTSVMAQSASSHFPAFANTSTDAPRVVQTVDANRVVTLARSHFSFLDGMKATSVVDAATPMNHLQLVLRRSAARQAALDQLSADQHNPNASRYRQWLTPKQYGDQFGVLDSDIAAASAWLSSQGFKVNAVYPNRMQIDFSGTAGTVDAAFHTQEKRYVFKDGSKHVVNAGDIQIPAALKDITIGVSGLDDVRPQPLSAPHSTSRHEAASTGVAQEISTPRSPKNLSIPNNGSPLSRLLVPNDMVTMYGIRTIRNNGVVGSGISIALIETGSLLHSSWDNFTSAFNLARYGGSLSQINPQGPADCEANGTMGDYDHDDFVVMDAEWATAIAPGANIVVANCNDSYGRSLVDSTMTNLVNASNRPNIISVDFYLAEDSVSGTYKTLLDDIWAQADVEGISVFVPTGNYGPGDASGLAANALATSPHVTAVGGTDLADVLDGTTDRYFAKTPSAVGGSALSYVPEIPWNSSCGNGVAAKRLGYNRVIGYCNDILRGHASIADHFGYSASNGAPSTVDAKPVWQSGVYNAANDQSRDVPDVAVFGGSFNNYSTVVICNSSYPCTAIPNSNNASSNLGTQMSSAVFSGIQALMDQGLAARGTTAYQGNAAPVLYSLAAAEYGTPSGTLPSTLSACNADNGATGTAGCVFHNVTRGSISDDCSRADVAPPSNCYVYSSSDIGGGFTYYYGLNTADASPTSYGVDNKAYGARPGWSFASGLGSVNATNLLIAWRAFENVSGPAHPSSPSQPAQAADLY